MRLVKIVRWIVFGRWDLTTGSGLQYQEVEDDVVAMIV